MMVSYTAAVMYACMMCTNKLYLSTYAWPYGGYGRAHIRALTKKFGHSSLVQ
jgi:hypothetical protein